MNSFITRKVGARLAVIALSAAVVVAGSALASSQKNKNSDPSQTDAKRTPVSVNVVVDNRPLTRDLGGHSSFSPVVKRVSPAVVKVTTVGKAPALELPGQEGPGMEDFLQRFFGDRFPGGQGQAPGQNPGQGQGQGRNRRNFYMPRPQGLGSGVIVTKDGYILTNNHVVDGADEVKVALQDGREFTAKVIGRDPKSDVAVVKIDAKDLPAVSIADSDKVEIGDVVLAIGNPFGIGQTVTTGIVSATGRGNMGLDYEDFIQTDAAINPGNSGGALVDAEGRLVGINTAILSRSGGNQGIGFAIPSNLARDVMTSLVKDGKVTRGYLGVYIQDVTPALARKFDLKEPTGALVSEVGPKSPAERAGVENGDIVVEFNGNKVSDSRHLKLAVARIQPGETVPLKVLRDGSTRTFEVKVKELPGNEATARNDANPKNDEGTLNGVTVSDLDRESRKEFDLPASLKSGVVVKDVEQNSAAAEAGLRPGDVILEINRKSVKTAEEAVKLTENPADKTTLLRVWSNGGTRWVVVDESTGS